MSHFLPNFLTEAQMQSLAGLPDRHTVKGLRDRALIGLLCATGLRASEACALQLRDLHADRVLVRCGKSGRQRWVPISPACARAVGRYLAAHPARLFEPVFRSLRGQALTRRDVHKIVSSYQLQLRLPRGVHLLRSSAATRWLNRGLDLHQVRVMLGHAHLATTGIYLGCAVDQLCRDYRQALAAPAPAGRP